jgi:hypothetical protein
MRMAVRRSTREAGTVLEANHKHIRMRQWKRRRGCRTQQMRCLATEAAERADCFVMLCVVWILRAAAMRGTDWCVQIDGRGGHRQATTDGQHDLHEKRQPREQQPSRTPDLPYGVASRQVGTCSVTGRMCRNFHRCVQRLSEGQRNAMRTLSFKPRSMRSGFDGELVSAFRLVRVD